MAFENLFKPPHLKRFLLAVVAAFTAILVYFTAEHFAVVPGTGALDEEHSNGAALGDPSLLVSPVSGDPPGGLSGAVSLEIISRLASQPELRVIAPHSALLSTGPPVRSRSQALPFGVSWVLEIRSEPEGQNHIISATLKSSGGAEHESTIASAPSAATLQSFINEVVLALADRLDLEPGGHESGSLEVPPEAFEGYLLARALLLQGGAGLEQAQETLEQTLELVPDWPPALAAYAYSLLLQTAAGADRDGSALAAARKILERARLLDPDLPQAWLYTSLMAHRFDWDWAAADDAARKALALATGDASVLSAASTAEFSLGKFDEGVEHLRKAIVLDPLVLSHRLKYGLMLEFDGQRQSAIDAYRDLMALDPAFPGVHAYLGRTLVIAGRAEAARRHMEIETSDFWRLYGTCLVLFALNRNAEAGLEMARLIREFGGEAAIQIAELYAYDGQLDRAFDWLEKAVEQRDPGVANLVGNPLLENLRNDPRWRDLLDMLRLPAE